jgi:phosphoserine phosphatase RsbU/P
VTEPAAVLPTASLLPPEVGEVVREFHRARGAEVWVWIRERDGAGWALDVATSLPPVHAPSDAAVEVAGGGAFEVRVEVPGTETAEVGFLASMLARSLRHDAEARFFGNELADRYEEITLLYTISEILGSVISLEAAASTILEEVVGTLRVNRAALWLHNPEKQQLELVAAVGGDGQSEAIAVDNPDSVTASVFRARRPTILDTDDEFPRRAQPPDQARHPFLSVPVSYTPPAGETRTIGVINLIGEPHENTFSAGDQKLVTAIASQVGAAVENSRLVAASLRQERIDREMELAHHLQLKLLPPLAAFDGYAEVAARCVPADSVGGDFYHLFRLPGGRIGVMIGDVSSHGFGAALIMALTMSAVAIHASEGDSPGEVLRRTHLALIDELESTEMYLTLFYGVIDPEQGVITYVNAGHAHAFRITGTGEAERLGATGTPFGMVDMDTYPEATAPWVAGEDLLFLFTDGLSDALGAGEVENEAILLDEVVRRRQQAPHVLLEGLFAMEGRDPNIPADDRTALLVRI